MQSKVKCKTSLDITEEHKQALLYMYTNRRSSIRTWRYCLWLFAHLAPLCASSAASINSNARRRHSSCSHSRTEVPRQTSFIVACVSRKFQGTDPLIDRDVSHLNC